MRTAWLVLSGFVLLSLDKWSREHAVVEAIDVDFTHTLYAIGEQTPLLGVSPAQSRRNSLSGVQDVGFLTSASATIGEEEGIVPRSGRRRRNAFLHASLPIPDAPPVYTRLDERPLPPPSYQSLYGGHAAEERPRYAAYRVPLFNVPLLVGPDTAESALASPREEQSMAQNDTSLSSLSASYRMRLFYLFWKSARQHLHQLLRTEEDENALMDRQSIRDALTLPLYQELVDEFVQPFEVRSSDIEHIAQPNGGYVARLRQDHPMYSWYAITNEASSGEVVLYYLRAIFQGILRHMTQVTCVLLAAPVLIAFIVTYVCVQNQTTRKEAAMLMMYVLEIFGVAYGTLLLLFAGKLIYEHHIALEVARRRLPVPHHLYQPRLASRARRSRPDFVPNARSHLSARDHPHVPHVLLPSFISSEEETDRANKVFGAPSL